MSSSYLRIVLHTTFSTKYREPTISPQVESGLYQLMDSRLLKLGCERYAIGGTMDHIHILHGLPRDRSIASILGDVKSISSKWMRARGYGDFEWQRGYACHSVDYRTSETVIRYVNNQKKKHYGAGENYIDPALLTFEEEFERLLVSYGMDYQRRWLFAEPPCTGPDRVGTAPPIHHATSNPQIDHQHR